MFKAVADNWNRLKAVPLQAAQYLKAVPKQLSEQTQDLVNRQRTARQASYLAPTQPSALRYLVTQLKPKLEQMTSPATVDFVNTLAGFAGANMIEPEEQKYYDELKTGQLSDQSKEVGKQLAQQQMVAVGMASRAPIAKAVPKIRVTAPVQEAQVVKAIPQLKAKAVPSTGGEKWFRGESQQNAGGIDKFYTTDKNIAGDFGKVSKLNPTEVPKNPLRVASKDDLAPLIGYKGDPMIEPRQLPKGQSFDALAKQYAQSKGHDGIIYMNGTFDAPELHSFSSGGEITSKYPDILGFKNTDTVTPIKSNGKIVGGIDATIDRFDPQRLNVHKVMIIPEEQGKGLGTNAVKQLLKDNPNVNEITGHFTAESKSFWKKVGAELDDKSTSFTITRLSSGGEIGKGVRAVPKNKSW